MNVVVWVLLLVAGAIALVSAIGALVMRDALQRLHYVAPPSTISAALVTVALFIGDHDKDVGLKAAFATCALAVMNGVIAHATARATRVHDHGTWRPTRNEHVSIRGREEEATS